MGISARVTFTLANGIGSFVADRIIPRLQKGIQVATDAQTQAAQGYAPVDTGRLQGSLQSTVEAEGDIVTGTTSTDVPYAPYVEFGTGRRGEESAAAGPGPYDPNWPGMAPQPYLRPASEEQRATLVDTLAANIEI